jgi:aryl-alcohol dehydrogenase-like predicted oxidoreductase
MQYRTFGKTGWRMSAIGMGCWAIGGNMWGPTDDADSIAAIEASIETGVNLLDTADAYGVGHSEELIGKTLGGRRKDLFLATKFGNWARGQGHPLPFTSKYHVFGCCDASLHRLRTDYIDLYQCHIGNPEDPDLFLEALEELVQVGKIRAYGISTGSLDAVKAFNRAGNCSVVQLDYSILNRKPEADLLPYCRENNIGTLIRGPLAMGKLTGKMTPATTFPDNDTRQKWVSDENRAKFAADLQTVERLRFLGTPERTMAQAALAFVLAQPGATVAIPGAKNPAQAVANARAADLTLPDAEMARVADVCPPPPLSA